MDSLLEEKGKVQVQGVSKLFGKTIALKNIDLIVEPGEFLTLLGPSGCGKTTLLRLISGLEEPTTGEILINGSQMKEIPPEKRPSNIVFQRYALFPHLNVWENIEYGLIAKGLDKNLIEKKINDVFDLVDMHDFKNRKIDQLSGGESQRIALARSLINEPDVLLLDEPLAALDLQLRKRMQVELRQIQKKLKTTFISVTHDQGEALAISDRVAVMNNGEIEQLETPDNTYKLPKNEFVASFVGESSFIKCKIIEVNNENLKVQILNTNYITNVINNQKNKLSINQEVEIMIRPELVEIDNQSTFEGIVTHKIFTGPFMRLFVKTTLGQEVIIDIKQTSDFDIGDKINLKIPNNSAIIMSPK